MQIEVFDGGSVSVYDYVKKDTNRYAEFVVDIRKQYDKDVHVAINSLLHRICKDTSSIMADVCMKESQSRSFKSIAFVSEISMQIENNPILLQRGIFLQPFIKKRIIVSYNIAHDKRVPKSSVCSRWPAQLSFCGILLYDGDVIVGQLSILGQKILYKPEEIGELYPLIDLLATIVGEERRKRTVKLVVEEMLRRRTVRDAVASAAKIDEDVGLIETAKPTIEDAEQKLELEEPNNSPSVDELTSLTDSELTKETNNNVLCTMSHEIRTPLSSIVGMSSLLGTAGELNEKQKEYLKILQEAVYHLMDTINDILDYEKLASKRLVLRNEEYNIRTVVSEAIDIVSFKLKEKHNEIIVDVDNTTPSKLVGDKTRLRQVLINLLYNSIKYTDDGSIYIVVKSKLTSPTVEEEDSLFSKTYRIEVSVRDTGVGISKEDLPNVFDTFNTTSTQKEDGVGLGLSISREIVRLMGGEITAESDGYGLGSKFSFGFVSIETFKFEDLLAKYKRMLSSKDVLVLDSSRANRMYLTDLLCSWGMRPTTFDTSDEALHRLHLPNSFGVCLIDATIGNEVVNYLRTERPSMAVISIGNGIVSYVERIDIPLNKPHKLLLAIVRSMSKSQKNLEVPTERIMMTIPSKEEVRILLVEDNLVNAFMIKEMLRSIGYPNDNTKWVQNGKESIEALQNEAYDICLMDIKMPVLDGLEATKLIKKGCSEIKKVPIVIAMTALTIEEDDSKWYDDKLSKPIDIERLRNVLKQYHT